MDAFTADQLQQLREGMALVPVLEIARHAEAAYQGSPAMAGKLAQERAVRRLIEELTIGSRLDMTVAEEAAGAMHKAILEIEP